MEGFLPLIEAILAFSLTMLALATAVSVIVGVVFRFLRSRAAGLREMTNYFFRNVVILLLEELNPSPGPTAKTAKPSNEILDTSEEGTYRTRIDFLVDMTFLPTVVEGDASAREGVLKRAEEFPTGPDPSRTVFCDWMSQLWGSIKRGLKIDSEQAGDSQSPSASPVESRCSRTERWLRTHPPMGWVIAIFWWIVKAYWWIFPRRISLKFGLDTLTEKEFMARLRTSRLAKGLVEAASSPEQYAELIESLRRSFLTLGLAYSEKFSRVARVLTILAGFGLAIAGNVDSVALVNSYMSDPKLRNQIIEQQESILSASATDGSAGAPDTKPPNKRIEENGQQIDKQIEKIKGFVDQVPSDSAKKALKEALNNIKTVKNEIQVTADEAERGYAEIQSTISGLTETFPVGWTLYPNCEPAIDARCLRYKKSKDELERKFGERFKDFYKARLKKDESGKMETAWEAFEKAKPEERPSVFPCYGFSFDDDTKVSLRKDTWSSWLADIQFVMPGMNGVCELDTAQYMRWLLGIVLTGLLLGLGTPFWIQAVNGFMRARNLMRGSGTEGDVRRDSEDNEDKQAEKEDIISAATAMRRGQSHRVLP